MGMDKLNLFITVAFTLVIVGIIVWICYNLNHLDGNE